jgi:hypothetical protein
VGARWATNSALFQGPGLRMVEYSAIWIRHQCCLAQVALCDAFLDPDGCSFAAVIAPPTYLRGSLEFWPHRGARSGLVADGCTCSALRLSMSTLVGRTIIIGITTLEHDGSLLEQAQKYGVIERIDTKGIAIRLSDGELFLLPPDVRALRPAPPGEYRFRSTGEVVTNPDVMTTWTITRPHSDHPRPTPLSTHPGDSGWGAHPSRAGTYLVSSRSNSPLVLPLSSENDSSTPPYWGG